MLWTQTKTWYGEKAQTKNETGLLTSSGVRVLGTIQINSGWNVPVGPPGPQSGAAPPDQIRTGEARPVKQSETRPARLWAARGWGAMMGAVLHLYSVCKCPSNRRWAKTGCE